MANCSNCSAPLPQNSISCEYCGSRNDVDLTGINYYTTNENDSVRTCPRCDISLRTIDLQLNGTFLIDRCEECLGIFFDLGELEALLEASVKNVFAINNRQLDNLSAVRPGDYTIAYIKCPVCSKLMNRVNFGIKSGVIVDRCRDHGVWLDGGELRHLLEWMKAGGNILQQERQEQLKRTEERELERKLRRELGGSNVEESSFDLFGSTLKKSDPDIFEIVSKAVRFFLK